MYRPDSTERERNKAQADFYRAAALLLQGLITLGIIAALIFLLSRVFHWIVDIVLIFNLIFGLCMYGIAFISNFLPVSKEKQNMTGLMIAVRTQRTLNKQDPDGPITEAEREKALASWGNTKIIHLVFPLWLCLATVLFALLDRFQVGPLGLLGLIASILAIFSYLKNLKKRASLTFEEYESKPFGPYTLKQRLVSLLIGTPILLYYIGLVLLYFGALETVLKLF